MRTALIPTLLISAILTLGTTAWAREHAPIRDVERSALPAEARQTLNLIERGGPYPYRRDGVVFQNREGRLPYRTRGCYHEYTVPTPEARDRGARRIIDSCDGPRYYTADHYGSFQRIQP